MREAQSSGGKIEGIPQLHSKSTRESIHHTMKQRMSELEPLIQEKMDCVQRMSLSYAYLRQ